MDWNSLEVIAVIFLAIFTQSLTGFGAGLVAMALLPALIGIRAAIPLVALTAGTLELILVIRFRSSLNGQSVRQLLLASVIGIPLGVLTLRNVDERIVLMIMTTVAVDKNYRWEYYCPVRHGAL